MSSFSLHTSQLREIRRGGEERLAGRKRKFVFHFHCIYEITANKKSTFYPAYIWQDNLRKILMCSSTIFTLLSLLYVRIFAIVIS